MAKVRRTPADTYRQLPTFNHTHWIRANYAQKYLSKLHILVANLPYHIVLTRKFKSTSWKWKGFHERYQDRL